MADESHFISEERFEKSDASVGTWWYKLTVSEEEKNVILRNQEIRKELSYLTKEMDTHGSVNKSWVKIILERILNHGLRAK